MFENCPEMRRQAIPEDSNGQFETIEKDSEAQASIDDFGKLIQKNRTHTINSATQPGRSQQLQLPEHFDPAASGSRRGVFR